MPPSNNRRFYVSELLDLSKYTFARTDLNSNWDDFVNKSPQGTIFCLSFFLAATQQKLGLWKAYKNKEWIGAIVTGESDDGHETSAIPFAIYAGLIMSPPQKNQPATQAQTEEFRFSAAAIHHLLKTYKTIHLGLSPEIRDMRPFLWHNYGLEKEKFDLELRYTSFVDLQDAGTNHNLHDNVIYQRANKSRRQEIRYGIEAGVTTRKIDELDNFINFYDLTFARQGITLNRDELDSVERICLSLKHQNLLHIFGTYTPNGTLANIAVYGIDHKRAYYLFGANHPDHRDSYGGTTGLYNSMNMLADMGHREVDLEGVNSPKRGYFKLSFGGSLTPYYRLTLTQP